MLRGSDRRRRPIGGPQRPMKIRDQMLDSMQMADPQTAYTTAALNANWLRLLVETLRSQGCEPQPLLEDCGLMTADLLRPELRVSPSQIDAAIRAALRHMPDRPLGL